MVGGPTGSSQMCRNGLTGSFRKNLHRIGHAASPCYSGYKNVEETPEHAIFGCPRFEAVRREIRILNEENFIEKPRLSHLALVMPSTRIIKMQKTHKRGQISTLRG